MRPDIVRPRSWRQLLWLVLFCLVRTASTWTLGGLLGIQATSRSTSPAPSMWLDVGDLLDDNLARLEQLEQGMLNDSYDTLFDKLSSTFATRVQRTAQDQQPYLRSLPDATRLSLCEEGDAYTITFHGLGIRPADVEVSVVQGVLTVDGHAEAAASSHRRMPLGRLWGRRAGRSSQISRSIRLPADADSDILSITYGDNEVTITLPKFSEAAADEEDEEAGRNSPPSAAERLAEPEESPRFARSWAKVKGYVQSKCIAEANEMM
jgi:HSP20 family molecular chaperone IbpA